LRHVYLLFVAAAAVVFAGFWPTFFSGALKLDAWKTLHGLTATGWMALLIAQAWLIGRDRNSAHRMLGRTSFVLFPLLVLTALYQVHVMLAATGPASMPRDLRLTLAWIDVWSIGLFIACYGLAITYRKTMDLHARFMGVTALIAIPPALGRFLAMNFPAFGGLPGALGPTFFFLEAVLVALIAWDALKGRFLPPYYLALAVFGLVHLTLWSAPNWGPFVGLARLIGLAEGL
jgi:hypothetical protein